MQNNNKSSQLKCDRNDSLKQNIKFYRHTKCKTMNVQQPPPPPSKRVIFAFL